MACAQCKRLAADLVLAKNKIAEKDASIIWTESKLRARITENQQLEQKVRELENARDAGAEYNLNILRRLVTALAEQLEMK
jgi:hypothetical protein